MRIFSQIFFPFDALKARFGTAFAERELPLFLRVRVLRFFSKYQLHPQPFFTILWIFLVCTYITAIIKLYEL